MTEQLTSPCSLSAQANILKLNGSSCLVSSSQSNFGSHLKQNLIHFQEYKFQPEPVLPQDAECNRLSVQGLGKKKLTIKIDEDFDYGSKNHERQMQEGHDKKQTQRQDRCRLKLNHKLDNESSEQESSHDFNFHISTSNLPYDPQQTIDELSKRNEILELMIQQKDRTLKELEDNLKSYEFQVQAKLEENKRKDRQIQNLDNKIRNIEIELQKAKEQVQNRGELQLSLSAYNEIQQKIKEKDNKVRQLAKINEKLKQLNRDLIHELKNSEKKVRDLEKQIQNNVCLATQENIHRLKESSLKFKQKQNIERHNGVNYNHVKTQRDSVFGHNLPAQHKEKDTGGPRRSLQRKKIGLSNTTSAGQLSQPKKAGAIRIGSSSSNTILNKKMMHK